jgi:hypothetical protein
MSRLHAGAGIRARVRPLVAPPSNGCRHSLGPRWLRLRLKPLSQVTRGAEVAEHRPGD